MKAMMLTALLLFKSSLGLCQVSQTPTPTQSGSLDNTYIEETIHAKDIPYTSINVMSTIELCKTIVGLPMTIVIWMYDSPQIGFERLLSASNSFSNFMQRPDAEDALVSVYKEYTNLNAVDDVKMRLDRWVIEIMLSHKQTLQRLSEHQKKEIVQTALHGIQIFDNEVSPYSVGSGRITICSILQSVNYPRLIQILDEHENIKQMINLGLVYDTYGPLNNEDIITMAREYLDL